ncbi:hypothetical protein [Microbacterium sp.]|uniref:hypothetical protein n=1 Tax=Microbacterium sp. TaxID=51671 RepID=UPI0033400422
MRRERTEWRGLPAWQLSDGGTSAVVVPGRGAKIVSLRDGGGREWLAQGDGRAVPAPGIPFEEAEMCGWDECAPTVSPSPTPRGDTAPDHGEAWDRAWKEVDGGLEIDLPSVGVRLRRTTALHPDGTLALTYRARAGIRGTTLLWAAHPLFRLGARDRISVDASAALWDVSGEPAAPTSRTRPEAPAPGSSVKFYTAPQERPRWARIDRPDGSGLTMTWRGAAIRTLGVWIDRSRFATEDVVAFEPSTGWYDSLEAATHAGRVLRLAPGQTSEWTLSIDFRPTRRN